MLDALVGRVNSPWFHFFLVHDPRPTLRKVKCPVLALMRTPRTRWRRVRECSKIDLSSTSPTARPSSATRPTARPTAHSAWRGPHRTPRGVASNAVGDTLWTIDGTTHEVAVEAPDGARRGAWTASDLVRPEGIATDGTDLWIVDAGSGIVRHYAGAAARTSGSIAATDSFPLDPANSSPSDLATDGTTIWVTDDIRDEVFVY